MTTKLTREQADWIRGFFGVDGDLLEPPQNGASQAFAPAPGPAGPPGTKPVRRRPPPDPVLETAKADLATKYSVKVGSEGGASWTGKELKPVVEAFDMVPREDKEALKGVEVDRVPVIDGDPNTEAEYQTSVDSTTLPATRTRAIKVANGTYVEAGPVPPAEQRRRIVHEVGHVVAKKAQIDADFADAQKVAELSAKIAAVKSVKDESDKVQQALHDAYNDWGQINDRKPKDAAERKAKHDDLAAMDAKIKQLDTQAKDFETKLAPLRADVTAAQTARGATQAAAAATRVPQATVDAGQAKLDAGGTAADTAATNAGAATGAMNAGDQRDSAEYRRATDAVATALKAYAAAIKAGKVGRGTDQQHPDAAENAIEAAIKTRDRARDALKSRNGRNPALAALGQVERGQNDLFLSARTQARMRDRTPKIQEFIDLVTREHIPPMTPYAQKSWPFKPEEFFAEAYSFWRTDPSKLPAPLLTWFQGGNYR